MTKRKEVWACNDWTNNAYLIEDIARLGHLKQNVQTLDPTYGNGVWWKLWRPTDLIWHDLKLDGHDLRALPYPDETFGQIVLDTPYVSTGGRETTTIKEFYERYGMTGAPETPELAQELLNDGLTEMHRLCFKKGIVVVKCMSYVSSGHVFPGEYRTYEHATELGFVLLDRFQHWGVPRMQPKRTRKDGKKVRQQHARNNYSTMFVFRKAA